VWDLKNRCPSFRQQVKGTDFSQRVQKSLANKLALVTEAE